MLPGPDRTGAARVGIAFMLAGVACISVNDMLIKLLSDRYPLHELVFFRSGVGLLAAMAFLQLEGGFGLLRTSRPGLHLVRAGLVVIANSTFFAGLAVIPLATATALFFVAPLAITLMSVPVLGERVGPRRMAAVAAGFVGVVLMLRPWAGAGLEVSRWTLCLPVIAALCYAGMQVLTRKLGATSRASALAFYIQATFLAVSAAVFLAVGDGRYADAVDNESLRFLLRPWVWPAAGDRWLFVVLGAMSAVIGYCMSQAYRLGEAATIAPFEYALMPLAIFWGWSLFGDVPGPWVLAGSALIVGAGLYVFTRERARARAPAGGRG